MAANPGGGPYKAVVLKRFQDIAMRMEDLITTGPQVLFDDSRPRQPSIHFPQRLGGVEAWPGVDLRDYNLAELTEAPPTIRYPMPRVEGFSRGRIGWPKKRPKSKRRHKTRTSRISRKRRYSLGQHPLESYLRPYLPHPRVLVAGETQAIRPSTDVAKGSGGRAKHRGRAGGPNPYRSPGGVRSGFPEPSGAAGGEGTATVLRV